MKQRVIRFIKKWRTEWAVFTVVVYLLAIPFTWVVFPDNNVWLGMLIVFAGLTSALNDLADRVGEDE